MANTLGPLMRAAAWLPVVVLVGTGTPVLGQADCSVVGQNTFVRDTLDEYYLWYQQLPDLDPALYPSPEAYLDAVRFRPLDSSFSAIAPKAETEAFYSDSEFVGIGFGSKQTRRGELRITQVFPDSPASEAGLVRGDTLLTVDGRPVPELLATGELGTALGPAKVGLTLELTWRARGGQERSARVTKRPVTIPTVSQTEVFDLDGLPVGYLHFRNFVEPSIKALNRAFAEFRNRGVVSLILDLRYNGGGLVDVAEHLAGLIGGMRTSGRVFFEMVHNDKKTPLNRTALFRDPNQALDLPDLVVITSQASASASELVINGLSPFIPVTTVGARTFGKPVGQYGFEFCDKVFFPVSFKSVNASGEGEYYDGLPVDCAAADELNRPLGSPEEASLAEALSFVRTGACSIRSTAAAQAQEELRSEIGDFLQQLDGWRQLVNAW